MRTSIADVYYCKLKEKRQKGISLQQNVLIGYFSSFHLHSFSHHFHILGHIRYIRIYCTEAASKSVGEKCNCHLTRYVNFSISFFNASFCFYSVSFLLISLPFVLFPFFLFSCFYSRSKHPISSFHIVDKQFWPGSPLDRNSRVKTNRFWSRVTHGFTINIRHGGRRQLPLCHCIPFLIKSLRTTCYFQCCIKPRMKNTFSSFLCSTRREDAMDKVNVNFYTIKLQVDPSVEFFWQKGEIEKFHFYTWTFLARTCFSNTDLITYEILRIDHAIFRDGSLQQFKHVIIHWLYYFLKETLEKYYNLKYQGISNYE